MKYTSRQHFTDRVDAARDRLPEIAESIGMPRIDANDKAGKIILGVFVVVGLVLALVCVVMAGNIYK